MIEIRIGVQDSPKELNLEIEEKTEDLMKRVGDILGGKEGILWMSDRRGKHVGIPSTKISYIEIEAETPVRSVGFARAGTE